MNKTLFLQIFVISIIAGAYLFVDFNKLYASIKGDTSYITQDASCDLHKEACEITIEDGTKFTLEVFPKHIPLMENLRFKVHSSNKDLKNLKLNIYATNMFMGDFFLDLKPQEDGSLEAKGTLPTCPVGKMQWNADLKVEKLTQDIGARFQFQTK